MSTFNKSEGSSTLGCRQTLPTSPVSLHKFFSHLKTETPPKLYVPTEQFALT